MHTDHRTLTAGHVGLLQVTRGAPSGPQQYLRDTQTLSLRMCIHLSFGVYTAWPTYADSIFVCADTDGRLYKLEG